MKIPSPPRPARRRRLPDRGYTLIELTIAMMMGMALAAMVLALVNQQLAFLRIFRTQSFLTNEAPLISNYLARVVGKADGFRLYRSLDDIKAGSSVTADASVLMLRFLEPDGAMRACALSYEEHEGIRGIYYRVVHTGGELSGPQWALTTKPDDVNFSIVQGILRVTLTGPNGEEVIYSGTQQL